MPRASINFWKIGFFAVTTLYCVHFLFLKREQSFGGQNVVYGSLPTKEAMNKLHKTMPTVPVPLPSFSGVSNGRPYQIFNVSANEVQTKTMLRNLDIFRKSDYARKNPLLYDFGEKNLSSLRVVVIPSAGKAFAATPVHYCCSQIDDLSITEVFNAPAYYHLWKLDPTCRSCLQQPVSRNGDYFAHFPYIADNDKGRAITLLRKPVDRLASQIESMRGLLGLMLSFGVSEEHEKVLSAILTSRLETAYKQFFRVDNLGEINFSDISKSIAPDGKDFAMMASSCMSEVLSTNRTAGTRFDKCKWRLLSVYPGMRGCQTRMLIGRNCFDAAPLSKLEIQSAKARIRNDFAFVGIIESWKKSVELFHAQFGGKMTLDEVQKTSSRHSNRRERDRILSYIIEDINYEDPADDEIYDYALRRFESMLNRFKHRIPKLNYKV